jgi:hypothetical protein
MRKTTAPYWEHEIYVGNVNEYVMPDVSIDEYVFGVAAVDKNGNESLVTPYVQTPHQPRPIATYSGLPPNKSNGGSTARPQTEEAAHGFKS